MSDESFAQKVINQRVEMLAEMKSCTLCAFPPSMALHICHRDIKPEKTETRDDAPLSSAAAELCGSYPYKQRGMTDGDKMSPKKWRGPKSNKVAAQEMGPEDFDKVEQRRDK